jgi:tripartite ATP-independent transporter DctP family solute receptor
MKPLSSIAGALLALGTLSLGALAPTLAQAQNYKAEYKLSTVVPGAFPWGKGGEIWANLVRERTGGRINIKVYPGVSLVGGDQTREFTAIRQGVIDMAVGSTINWSPQVKALNLFSLPFLMPDYAAIDALTRGPVGNEIFAILEKSGVVPLAWGENGFRELSNSRHVVRTPADLKGLKLRVVGSPLFLETMSALGANPVQMSWADAQPALASGAVDGQENPVSIYTAAKLHQVGQKFVTLWGYVADPLIFVVNREVWASWTPADRDIVRAAAVEAGQQEIVLARKGLVEPGQPEWKAVADNGVTVTRLTAAERDQFVIATRRVYARWKAEIGQGLVDQAEQAVASRKVR